MATTEFAVHGAEHGAVREPVVNDFSIQVATVNGSGSQSANTVLLRTIFQMGVPVSGKNMFPSNIAGLPTWYTIRASKKGYIARKKEIDFLVAMNPETAKEDVLSLAPGAVALYDEPLKLNELRSDLTFYAVPYDKITAAVCPEAKLRKLVQQHGVRRRGRAAAQPRHGRSREGAAQAVRREGQGRRAELERRQGRLRLCRVLADQGRSLSRSSAWTRPRA